MVNELNACVGVDVFHTERFFSLLYTRIGKGDLATLFVYFIILDRNKALCDSRKACVQGLGIGNRSGYDERSARIVDKDGVYLVDDGVMIAALAEILPFVFQVVAQVVETKFIVRSIRDVGR